MIVIGHKYVRIAHRIIKHLQLNDLRNGSGVLDSRSTQRVGMRECANEIRPVQYHRSSDATYLVAKLRAIARPAQVDLNTSSCCAFLRSQVSSHCMEALAKALPAFRETNVM